MSGRHLAVSARRQAGQRAATPAPLGPSRPHPSAAQLPALAMGGSAGPWAPEAQTPYLLPPAARLGLKIGSRGRTRFTGQAPGLNECHGPTAEAVPAERRGLGAGPEPRPCLCPSFAVGSGSGTPPLLDDNSRYLFRLAGGCDKCRLVKRLGWVCAPWTPVWNSGQRPGLRSSFEGHPCRVTTVENEGDRIRPRTTPPGMLPTIPNALPPPQLAPH